MLYSGKKIRALHDKKNKYSNSRALTESLYNVVSSRPPHVQESNSKL